MTKLIFFGCLSTTKYKETCENASKIIKFLDNEYQVLEDVPCCGSLLYHTAKMEKLKNHVNSVNDWFKKNGITEITTICAGCYNYLSRFYKELISDFNINVRHLMQLMVENDNLEKLNLKYPGKKLAINYHDPCHLKNAVNPIIDEPRKILKSIDKLDFREMENNGKFSICCGAGGGVYSSFKESSDFGAVMIFKQMRKTKALITPCPFCYTALKRIYDDKKNKIRTPVFKFEDFVIKLMEGEDPLA